MIQGGGGVLSPYPHTVVGAELPQKAHQRENGIHVLLALDSAPRRVPFALAGGHVIERRTQIGQLRPLGIGGDIRLDVHGVAVLFFHDPQLVIRQPGGQHPHKVRLAVSAQQIQRVDDVVGGDSQHLVDVQYVVDQLDVDVVVKRPAEVFLLQYCLAAQLIHTRAQRLAAGRLRAVQRVVRRYRAVGKAAVLQSETALVLPLHLKLLLLSGHIPHHAVHDALLQQRVVAPPEGGHGQLLLLRRNDEGGLQSRRLCQGFFGGLFDLTFHPDSSLSVPFCRCLYYSA